MMAPAFRARSGAASSNASIASTIVSAGEQEGSGLGLAIVRHVVQAHGGQVRVRNRPEGGAEFSILLPAV